MKTLLILSLTTLSLCANGFTLSSQPPSKFSKNKIIVNVASNNCAQSVTAGELLALAEKAVNLHWNSVATCAIQIEKGNVIAGVNTSTDTLTEAYAKASVGTILIGCSDKVTGTTLGIGDNLADKGIILINDSTTSFANLSEVDKLATLAHEIGHAFGLGHSSDPVALMYFTVGGTIRENLTLDDYDGCSYLYPHSSPGSCNSVNIITDDKSGSEKGIGFFSVFLLGIAISALGALGVRKIKS